jgi:hypothetical protein
MAWPSSGTRAVTQDFRQGIAEGPWLGELDHVTVGHGVSLPTARLTPWRAEFASMRCNA